MNTLQFLLNLQKVTSELNHKIENSSNRINAVGEGLEIYIRNLLAYNRT